MPFVTKTYKISQNVAKNGLIPYFCTRKLWGIVDIEWLNRTAEEPWATYFAPVILIIVGASLIYDFCKAKENK